MDKYNDTKEIFCTAGDYVVQVCVVRDPILEEDTLAYGIYNKVTGVREAEARRFTNAISLCKFLGEGEETAATQMDLSLPATAHRVN